MSQRPRLLLVDDHDVVRVGTRALLEEDFDIIGEADNAQSAIELCVERRPDIVLLDVRLPGGGGELVAQRVRELLPDICIVAFTVSINGEDVRRMMKAGVDGYLTKTTESESLADLLGEALAGLRPVASEVAGFMLDIDEDIPPTGPLSKLTPREREVVVLIARGYSYVETAREMGISVKTLETHMGHIFTKLGIASRHQLSNFMPGLLHPDLDDARDRTSVDVLSDDADEEEPPGTRNGS
jgi:DNA-binding NarL/FixJ family response regulator